MHRRTLFAGAGALLAAVIAASAAEPQPKANGNDAAQLKAAQDERVKVLRQLLELLTARYKTGQVSVAEVLSAEAELGDAMLESADTPGQRIVLLTNLLAIASDLLAITQTRFDNGQTTASDVLRAKSACLGVKVKLLRERTRKAAAPN